jgi:redox-sensitive bicupin YhaK (pirin superfamily)
MEGAAKIEGQNLGRRDAMGLWDTGSIEITATEDCRLLLIEVPMHW